MQTYESGEKVCYPEKTSCVKYDPVNQGCLKCKWAFFFELTDLEYTGLNYCVLHWYWLVLLVVIVLVILGIFLWGFENWKGIRSKLPTKSEEKKQEDSEEGSGLINANPDIVVRPQMEVTSVQNERC